MIMLDTVDFPFCLGSNRAGIIPTPLKHAAAVEQFRYILQDSRAKALFVSPTFLKAPKPRSRTFAQDARVAGDAHAHYPSFGKMLEAESAAAPADTSGDEVALWL